MEVPYAAAADVAAAVVALCWFEAAAMKGTDTEAPRRSNRWASETSRATAAAGPLAAAHAGVSRMRTAAVVAAAAERPVAQVLHTDGGGTLS